MFRWAGILMSGSVMIALGHSANAGAPRPTLPARALSVGQVQYSQNCGGCHGLMGLSASESIPVLSDHVGTFLCTQEGRDYIVRLPNVAFANMNDEELASAMNFMVFGLGGTSVPAPGGKLSR